MCCDLIFVILVCQYVGGMVKEKGRDPLIYQVLMGVGWIGGGIIGGVGCAILAGVVSNGDAIGLGAGIGYLLGIACGAGPVYLLAMNVTKDPNYRPPQPTPGSSPYGPSPYGPAPGASPYAPPPQNPFANNPVNPQPTGAAAAPGIPSFLPASAFAPAPAAPSRVQFYCPSGHLLEEWSTAAGEQRRCPHCGGIAAVPITG